MRALVIGCGYVGLPVTAELVRRGHTVTALRRSAVIDDQIRAAGAMPIRADITQPSDLEKIEPAFDWVVDTVSSARGGSDLYRGVFFDGTRNVLAWLERCPLKKFVFTSSTSVYGQTDSSAVKESSPADAAAETSRILIQAENLLLDAFRSRAFPSVILRVSGIYGPDRGHLFQQYLRGDAKISGRGERFLNMVHQEDVAGAVISALQSGRPGEIYNVTDDEPVAELHFFRWLSETLGKWMPGFDSGEETGMRKRQQTNKKVQNRKLKMELGFSFKYPTFRQGYTAEITRLERLGKLDIQPDSRTGLEN